jgi:hypothetical protein
LWPRTKPAFPRSTSSDRNEVFRQVYEIIEHELKSAEPLLNAAPAEMKRWERLNMLTDVVSKKVLHWLVEHPELSQSAVELIIAPVVEERDRERLRKKRYRSEAGDRWVSLNPANP